MSGKKLVLVPNGWPCTLAELEPGPFMVYPVKDTDTDVCHKTEYRSGDKTLAYCSSGETFCLGEDTLVQGLRAEWLEE